MTQQSHDCRIYHVIPHVTHHMIQNPQIRSHDLHMTKHMIMVITTWLVMCSKTPPDPDQSESPDHSLQKPLEPSRPCTWTIWHAHDIMHSKAHGPTHEPRARPFQNLPLLRSRLQTAEWRHCAVYCCTPKCSYWTSVMVSSCGFTLLVSFRSVQF